MQPIDVVYTVIAVLTGVGVLLTVGALFGVAQC